ncbi:MAG: NADH-quinone oxidoreductase subunit C [Planctomycetota bacterium JB042]
MTDTKPAKEAAEARLREVAEAHGAEFPPAPADGLFCCFVDRERWAEFVRELRDDPALRFRICLDVTAVDWYGKEPRFEVVAHLYSVDLQRRIRVKTRCSERDASVPSLVPIHPSADYHERETFDMFGIRFEGHPDLRRILMPPDYEHHPLRKEFPVEGIEPEKVYRRQGGVMMPRPDGAEAIEGAGSTTP